jgi:hypothetical protein
LDVTWRIDLALGGLIQYIRAGATKGVHWAELNQVEGTGSNAWTSVLLRVFKVNLEGPWEVFKEILSGGELVWDLTFLVRFWA